MPGPVAALAVVKAIQVGQEVRRLKEDIESEETADGSGKASKLLKSAARIGATIALPGGGRSVEGFRQGLELSREGVSQAVRERVGSPQALRRNLEAAGQEAPEGAQANHQVPREAMRDHPLGKAIREALGDGCVDEARNGEFLPRDELARSGFENGNELPLHRGAHPVYSQHVYEAGTRIAEQVRDRYGSLEDAPREVLDKAYDKWIQQAHDLSRDPSVQTQEGKLR